MGPFKALIDALPEQAGQLVFALAGLAVAIVLGGYLIGKIRASYSNQEPSASDMLTDFREMHSQGDLSDEEFRTIKSMLSGQLAQEVKRTTKDG